MKFLTAGFSRRGLLADAVLLRLEVEQMSLLRADYAKKTSKFILEYWSRWKAELQSLETSTRLMKEESKLGCIVPPVTLQTRGDELSNCAYPVSQLHGHGLCTGVSLLIALACVLGGRVEGGGSTQDWGAAASPGMCAWGAPCRTGGLLPARVSAGRQHLALLAGGSWLRSWELIEELTPIVVLLYAYSKSRRKCVFFRR